MLSEKGRELASITLADGEAHSRKDIVDIFASRCRSFESALSRLGGRRGRVGKILASEALINRVTGRVRLTLQELVASCSYMDNAVVVFIAVRDTESGMSVIYEEPLTGMMNAICSGDANELFVSLEISEIGMNDFSRRSEYESHRRTRTQARLARKLFDNVHGLATESKHK